MNAHLHEFDFECTELKGHKHRLSGYTESIIGFNIFHFHYFTEMCTYNGHTHYYSGITGLPVKTENGHIHKVEGILQPNNHHEHGFNGYTFEEVQYISKRNAKTALV